MTTITDQTILYLAQADSVAGRQITALAHRPAEAQRLLLAKIREVLRAEGSYARINQTAGVGGLLNYFSTTITRIRVGEAVTDDQ